MTLSGIDADPAADRLDRLLEAALFAAGEALSLDALQGLFDEESAPERSVLLEALERLQTTYRDRGIELVRVASGWRFQVAPPWSTQIARLWQTRPGRYSRALLETLAIIVYRQPVTRAEIEEIRGVAVSASIMRTLSERGWIRSVGQRDVPGRPALYATTRRFLDDFNLESIAALPPLMDLADPKALLMDEPAGSLPPGEETGDHDGQ